MVVTFRETSAVTPKKYVVKSKVCKIKNPSKTMTELGRTPPFLLCTNSLKNVICKGFFYL